MCINAKLQCGMVRIVSRQLIVRSPVPSGGDTVRRYGVGPLFPKVGEILFLNCDLGAKGFEPSRGLGGQFVDNLDFRTHTLRFPRLSIPAGRFSNNPYAVTASL